MVVYLFCDCLTCRQPLTQLTRLRSTFGCSGTVLDWFISYLSCRTQSVFLGHESTPSVVQYEVPQDSVPGPLLFTLYTQPLSTVICQSIVFPVISLQMIPSFTNQVFLLTFLFLPVVLKDCTEDVAEWMGDSKLKMSDDKTELMAIGTMSILSQVIPNLALCPSLVVIYHSLSLLETLVFT